TLRLIQLESPLTLAPGLPPPIAVAQAVKRPVRSETRLLQRFLPIGTGQAANIAPAPIDHALGAAQAGCSPGLFGAVPFDPGQTPAFGVERGRRIEIGPLDQHAPPAAIEGKAHQAMLDTLFAMVFFQRDDGVVALIELQVAVTTL